MTSDKPQPSSDKPPRRTMCAELLERLKAPIFQKIESPQGGGVVITGCGPVTPHGNQEPAGTEPQTPEPEADDERE